MTKSQGLKMGNMKSLFAIPLLVLLALAASAGRADDGTPHEMWKGPSRPSQFDVGALAGASIMNGSAGFGLMGTGAIKIVDRGFANDLSDQVFVEAEMGPTFISNSTVFTYSIHLRWDFNKDDDLAFYALGGVGGSFAGAALANQVQVYPRFGVGLLWRFADRLALRAEISHELLAAGISFEL